MNRFVLILVLLTSSSFAATTVVNSTAGAMTLTGGAWAVAETGTSAILNGAANYATATATVVAPGGTSAAFTVTNGDTISGVLMFCQYISGGGNVTISFSNGAPIAGANTTVVAATLPTTYPAWTYFTLATPFTGTGGSGYMINVQSTVAGSCKFGSTSGSLWARVPVTNNCTATAAAGMNFYIVAPVLGGASNTVTFNDVSGTNAYGNIDVGYFGIASLECAGSTAYSHQFAQGALTNIWNGGVLYLGSVGTPVPSTSSSLWYYACTGAGGAGMIVNDGGKLYMYGNTKTSLDMLTADVSAAGTSITTANVNTTWLSGDNIVFPASDTTNTHYEAKALTANQTTNTVAITALTNAHKGTAPIAVEVGNYTRNNVFKGNSTTNYSYINCQSNASVQIYYSETYNLGGNSAGKYGICQTLSAAPWAVAYGGSALVDVENCGIHDIYNGFSAIANGGSYKLYKNVIYNSSNTGISGTPVIASSASGIIDNNLVVKGGSSGAAAVDVTEPNIQVTNNWVQGSSYAGIAIHGNGTIGAVATTVSGNTCQCNSSFGMQVAVDNSTISNTTLWGNGTGAFSTCYATSNTGRDSCKNCIFNGMTIFGNNVGGIDMSGMYGNTFNNVSIQGTATAPYTQTYGMWVNTGLLASDSTFNNCSLGTTTNLTSGAFYGGAGAAGQVLEEIYLYNCSFGATVFTNQTMLGSGSSVYIQRLNGTAGSNINYTAFGTDGTDTTIALKIGQTTSERITPLVAASKMASSYRNYPVASGQTTTVQAWIRTSTSADGTAYGSSNMPRLMLAQNLSQGWSSKVLATVTPVTGTITAGTGNGVSPIVLTCTAHGLSEGDCVTIAGATGNTNSNGNFQVHVVSSSQFSLNGTTGNGTWGGTSSFSKWVKVTGSTNAATENGLAQVYVDCDGTTGWVNIDWPAGSLYWANGTPWPNGTQTQSTSQGAN